MQAGGDVQPTPPDLRRRRPLKRGSAGGEKGQTVFGRSGPPQQRPEGQSVDGAKAPMARRLKGQRVDGRTPQGFRSVARQSPVTPDTSRLSASADITTPIRLSNTRHASGLANSGANSRAP